MDPFIRKLYNRPINEKYVLMKKLGKGGFGAVYLTKDLVNDQELALKLEHHSIDPSFLEDEARRYEAFQNTAGFPKVYWFGWHDDFRVMAFELLGPSLEDLFAYCGHRFSLQTTLMIADQILVRLEELHSIAVIHRDIKPQNFLLGSGTKGNVIYVTDFGLADEYIIPRGNIEETSSRSRLVGTARFASIRGHKGQGQSPKDDLESLGYMIVYFLRGKLPWQGLKVRSKGERERAVMEKKMATSAEQLCEELPKQFAQYMQEVKKLQHADRPDYAQLRHRFRRLAREKGLKYDNVFDWTVRLYVETERARSQSARRKGGGEPSGSTGAAA